MAEKKLFLLDGMALVYRAYFAFQQNPRMTSYGLNASAMFGFTNTLMDVLSKQKPTHIAVVFDTSAPTQRHIDFEAYKAHREEMPEDLKKSLPYINRIIEGFNIPVIAMDGYEADDVIGTLALKCGNMGYEVYMMTPDKDYGQLVRDNVFIYKPGRMGNPDEVLGVNEILKKWEVDEVSKVIEILGLWGDSVDNIPGVPGVGEKTAKKLIAEYGTIENILANTDKLKGKQKENFENFREQALMSKKLATIITDVPVEFDEKKYEVEEVNKEKLAEVFNELEFRFLSKKILGESTSASSAVQAQPAVIQGDLFASIPSAANDSAIEIAETPTNFKTIETENPNYILIDTQEKRKELISKLLNANEFCFDTETTGLIAFDADIVGLSFCIKEKEAYYIPFPQNFTEAKNILEEFKSVFQSLALKIAQNIKYDYTLLARYGIEVGAPMFDTMLAHYVIEPDQRHNMNILSENYLNYRPISIEDLIGKKGKDQGNMAAVPVDKIKDYAAEDADITFQLKQKIAPIVFNRNVHEVLEKIEIPLVPVLSAMEREGVKIDVNFLREYSMELGAQSATIEKDIYELAGEKFLISSPQQVGNILFGKMQLIENPKKTKTGQFQTDEETLIQLANEHEIVRKILDYRQLNKLKSTYVDALPELVNTGSGRVHTSFNQAVAATGRLSSQGPNLQNIPIRTEMGKEVRKAFVARDENHVLLSCDYSQIELRIIAHVSKDEGMCEAFNQNIDIHTATASKVWGVPLDQVDKEMRRKAKTVNFGIIYGISAFGLSQRVNIPRKEAKEIIDNYFMQFPGIKNYMDETIQFARDFGYVQTIKGRRRYIRDINSKNATVRGFAERNAINAPIQGSAADMIKLAMIQIHDFLKSSDYKTKMILQVHDELLFDVPKNEIDAIKPKIIEIMSNAMPLSIPVIVEGDFGNNWLDAH